MGRLLKIISGKNSAIAIAVGVAALVTAVIRLLPPRTERQKEATPVPRSESNPAVARSARVDYFTVRRSTSDIGYSYWVVQGHGCFSSFALFDTWREAIEAVNERLALQLAGAST